VERRSEKYDVTMTRTSYDRNVTSASHGVA
jgi:hypothetical protein